MKTSTRRSLGAVVIGISAVVAVVFWASGTPLLTLQESNTTTFPGGSATAMCFKVQWPLLAVCICGLIGLVALAWPQRKPPRLQS